MEPVVTGSIEQLAQVGLEKSRVLPQNLVTLAEGQDCLSHSLQESYESPPRALQLGLLAGLWVLG